ncbi:hypothetical protein [Alicyclobacillus ferrooxydans]|uniref:Uncharacterized protein n=1 Tax=Alicyclobacillus ferrooxydans TaxID=471514 RepID=A0A0P9CSS2_9BACL|nr:hypothetical protein [Alicyclobacillus ferrooxydans]KPV42694.1 hypothetical protein AN477_16325 [Alicyclobacillus ferrooxydans]
MTRIVNRPIQVTDSNPQGFPVSFIDKNNEHCIVLIVDDWRESGNWIEGEPTRHLYRILTDTDACLELQEQGSIWSIYKVYD